MTRDLVVVDGTALKDWDSFHHEFARLFGFPEWYGKNMDAWIDCMSSLASPEDGMSSVHCPEGQVVTLKIDHAAELKAERWEIFSALLGCAGTVNQRQVAIGKPPVLALAFNV
jgi:hypothetical protein